MSVTSQPATHAAPPASAGTLPSAGPLASAQQLPSVMQLPSAEEILAFAPGENFPVALKVLHQPLRDDLMAVYGFARLVDNIGDNYKGDRLAALDLVDQELSQTYDSQPTHAIFQQLQPAIQRRKLSQAEFVKLIQANRLDQTKSHYANWPELMEYCELSANPVGRLVLQIFGSANARNIELSDAICSALQVAEHLQDVGEDFRAGRVYLPAEELASHNCSLARLEADVKQGLASPALKRVVCQLAVRARGMLASGAPLVGQLKGQQRLAIAGFVAGGHAALDAIEAADGEVLSALRKPRKSRLAQHFARLLWLSLRLGKSKSNTGAATRSAT